MPLFILFSNYIQPMTNLTETKEKPQNMAETSVKQAIMFGCGNMGQALLSGWAAHGGIRFSVVDPAEPDLGDSATVYKSAADLPDQNWDLAIIAVKPQLIPVIMESAGHIFSKAALILSIAAGVSMQSLEKHVGARPVVRMMPNMPASIRKGVSGLYPNSLVSRDHKVIIDTMAEQNGTHIWLEEEDAIDRFTAIAGSGPGYVFEILRLYTIAAMELGFEEAEARTLVTQTLLGSAEMATTSDKSLEDLRKSVTSKNGTTQAGLQQLMANDTLKDLFSETLKAAYNRAVELR